MMRAARDAFVIEYVRKVRRIDPGIGALKLWHMYRRDFSGNSPVGRDRFIEIMSCNGMILRKRLRRPRTTDSRHGLPTYPNLIKEMLPLRPNQLWVSDITYIIIWTDDIHYRFCYLSIVLDAYTEEIVGYCVGPTLETSYPIEALCMALGRLKGMDGISLIHHPDRGVQYASSEYVRLLNKNGISISMTETGDPKDNAQAERINGTIKNELLKGMRFTDIGQVREAVATAVDFYNNERPHMSINMMTPAQAASCQGEISKRWSSFRTKAIKNRQECSDIGEDGLSLPSVHGVLSGLRPPRTP